MREKLWKLATRGQPDNILLPWWLLVVFALLYPGDFIFWQATKARGYHWPTNSWRINGVLFSAKALKELADARGEYYRVGLDGEYVTIERVDTNLLAGPNSTTGDAALQ